MKERLEYVAADPAIMRRMAEEAPQMLSDELIDMVKARYHELIEQREWVVSGEDTLELFARLRRRAVNLTDNR